MKNHFKKLLLFGLLGAMPTIFAEKIKLESSNDKKFEIEKKAAEQSITIKNMLADIGEATDQPIPLPNIDGATLGHMVEFLTNIDKNPKKYKNPQELITLIKNKNLDLENLIKIVNATNYLDIPTLLDAATTVLAEYINTNPSNLEEKVKKLPLDILKLVMQKLNFKETPFKTLMEDRSVTSVAWSPDSKKLASGSDDGIIKTWDTNTWQKTPLKGHTSYVHSVAWSPDGTKLASGSYDDKTIKIWDANNGKELKILKGHTGDIISVAWSPDGTKLASGSNDETIKIWDAKNWKKLQTLTGHEGAINSVAWSPDGTKLASGSHDETIKIWNAKNGTELQTLTGHTAEVTSVAWSPDGTKLASGSHDKTIKIWDANNGKELQILRGHKDSVYSVAWSPDGKNLASGSDDKTIKIWNTNTWKELQTLTGHEGAINSVAWSPDGTKLASGSHDKTIKIWERESEIGKKLQEVIKEKEKTTKI